MIFPSNLYISIYFIVQKQKCRHNVKVGVNAFLCVKLGDQP